VNFISPASELSPEGTEPILTIELGHVWRSKIVDKCAEAERYLIRLLRAGGGASLPKAPLSQKMGNLGRLIGEGECALRDKKIRPLLERLEPLSKLRSELVHSTMSVAEIEGEKVAVLRNAAADDSRMILSLADFKARHAELSRIVNSLQQETNNT